MKASERIETILSTKGLNAKTFSELCGYDRPQAVYDLIKGRTQNISAAMADRILRAFPDVSRVWLLTGEGPLNDEMTDPNNDGVPVKTVPLVPLSAIAGPLTAYYERGVELSRCPQIISLNPNAELALPVSGDSMEPTFADGSTVFIKRINEEAFIPWGHTMVLDTENGVFIKNVMPDDINTSYIWAESINPKYPRMHIPKKSIAGIYRVLAVSKSFPTM